MDGQSENLREPRSEPVAAGLAPLEELETDEVPDSMVSDFSSLTTPYCWVIIEDAVAGYDGAEPSAVGKSGPGQVAVRGKPTAHTDRPSGWTPSAIRPWTPRHRDLQRYKVTSDGTEKNGPHSREFPASGPFLQVVAGVGFQPT